MFIHALCIQYKKKARGRLKKAGVGQPKYCNNAYVHVVLTNLCSIFSIFKVFWSGHDLFWSNVEQVLIVHGFCSGLILKKLYKRGTFSDKMVYKRVRGWTSGRTLLVQNFVHYSRMAWKSRKTCLPCADSSAASTIRSCPQIITHWSNFTKYRPFLVLTRHWCWEIRRWGGEFCCSYFGSAGSKPAQIMELLV